MTTELLERVRIRRGEGNIGREICLERNRISKIMARTQIETQRRTCGYRERRKN